MDQQSVCKNDLYKSYTWAFGVSNIITYQCFFVVDKYAALSL